ncbi:MAG: carboxypeptidase regulatory-like domain-containing protein [Sphingomonadales bacterium]
MVNKMTQTVWKAGLIGLTALALAGTAHAAKYKEVAVENGGSITGQVSIGSAEVKSQEYVIAKDPHICGTGTRVVRQVRSNGGALLDAVVYLDKVPEGKAFADESRKITVNQEKCGFEPYLSVMVNEGELEAVNSDPTLHNIHTYELIGRARRTVLNISQPDQGNRVTKKIKLRKGVAMKVECDAHDFMHAFVFVARNPYFAKVDDAGRFEIGDVPPGKYVIKVWHGTLGEQIGEIEVSGDASQTVNFSF